MRVTDLAQPDVTLLLDMSGTIREASFANGISSESMDAWLGRPWFDTVKDHGHDKVQRLLKETSANGICAFRQMTQCFPSGLELPMEYTAVLLGGRAGILAIGKNLRAVAELQSRLIAAQQSIERDYWRIRDVETRYRLLFETSNEAVLLLSASSLRILEANPAAVGAMGFGRKKLDATGREFIGSIAPEDRGAFQAMLQVADECGKAPTIVVRLENTDSRWMVRASLMPVDSKSAYLLQMNPVATTPAQIEPAEKNSVAELLDQLPDGFVVIDQRGIVRSANRAFLDLVQMGSLKSAIGQSLERWLCRPGVDGHALVDAVFRYGSVKLFNTSINGELGSETEVEISAASHDGPRGSFAAIVVRHVARRLSPHSDDDHFAAMLASLVGQIGKTPLRKLVKDTVIEVEREYVKAALGLSKGKRTAAAEILGLSRQSLYQKLNRYGLDESSAPPADIDE